MAHGPESDRGTYLPTGWRVTGAGADRIAEQAAAYGVERVEPGAAADTLYAVQFTLDPIVGGRPAVERVLESVTDEIRQTWPECPRLLRDEPVQRAPSRFSGMRFDVLAEPGREWLGEVLWRGVHPVAAGVPITTRLLLEERPDWTRVSVRVTADDGIGSVRGHVGAGQAQPAFLRSLRRDGRPVWLGAPVAPRYLHNGDITDLVHGALPSATRDYPLAVLAPTEDGDYVVDPEELAWQLLGRARLWVITAHPLTFQLTDTIGDIRMSCFRGAVRAYMPGWTRHDDPYDHPLLLADRLADPFERAVWLGELGTWLGTRAVLPPSIDERLEERRPATSHAADGATAATPVAVSTGAHDAVAPAEEQGRPEPGGLAAATSPGPVVTVAAPDAEHGALLHRVLAEVGSLAAQVGRLTDELERLRTIAAVRASSTAAIERRLGRLEDLLARPEDAAAAGGAETADDVATDTSAGDEGRPTLHDVVRSAAEAHPDALVLLDSALAAAADSPYEDAERVRAILDAMARVARRRRDGVLGMSLREAFGDLGIDYRGAIARSTPARLREQYRFPWRGVAIEAEEHIVLGNTYDPRRCLRIYFSSRVPDEPRFVIGHVGRHFEVMTTT